MKVTLHKAPAAGYHWNWRKYKDSCRKRSPSSLASSQHSSHPRLLRTVTITATFSSSNAVNRKQDCDDHWVRCRGSCPGANLEEDKRLAWAQ